ncbi:heme-binding protein [Gordonia sp. NPDC058843]|uniref:GlcG/HbpS family heme-binding protein n=1 Tax=Gordonia sp. NPDC058843 TaxID=3346648 RepID=UPI00367C20BE
MTITVTLSQAQKVVAAALEHAEAIGQPVNVAVVDSGGNLITHVRQDGAWIGSVDIAISKAWTSRAFDISTADLSEHAQPHSQFFGIQHTNGGRVAVFAGGVPLRLDGAVVGAIGVSGGSGAQDQAIAEAGAQAL